MPSYIATIEIYENDDGSWYYGCPAENLMVYDTILQLLVDLRVKLAGSDKENSK